MYYLQTPRISLVSSSVGVYPERPACVRAESAICFIKLEFWSTKRVSCSRSQSSALITTKSLPFRRVTLMGICSLITCSTKLLSLSRNWLTLIVSTIAPSNMYGNTVHHSLSALTVQSTRTQFPLRSNAPVIADVISRVVDYCCFKYRPLDKRLIEQIVGSEMPVPMGVSPFAYGPGAEVEGIKRGSPGPGRVARGCLHAGNDAW